MVFRFILNVIRLGADFISSGRTCHSTGPLYLKLRWQTSRSIVGIIKSPVAIDLVVIVCSVCLNFIKLQTLLGGGERSRMHLYTWQLWCLFLHMSSSSRHSMQCMSATWVLWSHFIILHKLQAVQSTSRINNTRQSPCNARVLGWGMECSGADWLIDCLIGKSLSSHQHSISYMSFSSNGQRIGAMCIKPFKDYSHIPVNSQGK